MWGIPLSLPFFKGSGERTQEDSPAVSIWEKISLYEGYKFFNRLWLLGIHNKNLVK